jgi:transposase
MKGFLTVREISILEEAHRAAQRKKAADRIKTILLLNKGLSYTQIAEILMLDQTTARRYEHEYHQTGIDGLLEDHYQGSVGSLTDEQEQALTVYLKTNLQQTAKEAAAYIQKSYGVRLQYRKLVVFP